MNIMGKRCAQVGDQPVVEVVARDDDVVVPLPPAVVDVATRGIDDVVDPVAGPPVVDGTEVVLVAVGAVDGDGPRGTGVDSGASTTVVVTSSVVGIAGARVVVVGRAGVDVAGAGTTYTTATGAGRSRMYAARATRKITVKTIVERRSRLNRSPRRRSSANRWKP
jgi:hypothetical protein